MIVSEKIAVDYRGKNYDVSVKKRIGAGTLLLFLHGLGCAKEGFDGAFSAPELDDHSLCAMDFLGFGGSDKPVDFSYKMEDQAAVARQVIEQLSPSKVSIVAHSMGGAVGLLLAPQLNSLDRFVNVEGNLVSQDCGLVSRGIAQQPGPEFEKQGLPDFLHMLRSSQREDFHAWSGWLQQASPQAVHASAQSMVKWSDSGQLLNMFNTLAHKTYVYGDEEPKDYLLPRLQNTKTLHLPGLHHFMMTENPPAFFGAVAEVISK